MNQLTGTLRLVRLALRRDRIKLPIAVASAGLLVPLFVPAIKEIFAEDEAAVQQLISLLVANPATRLFGLPTGGEMGDLLMLRTFVFVAVIIALISTFTVIRHTRQNEELGRSELIGANVVGRHAGLAAAMIVVVGTNAVIALLAYMGLVGSDLPRDGSLAMAAGWFGVGLAFSSVAAFCAQLTSTSRSANSLAAAIVGLAFLLAGLGSVLGAVQPSGLAVEPFWLTWLSPIGWGQLVYPFAGEDWRVLGIFAVFSFAVVGASVALSARRDVGGGIFESRAGRPEARRSLLSLAGLTWRLNRGVFVGWLVAITILGALYGAVASSVEDMLSQVEGIAEIFISTAGTDQFILAFFGAIMGILGIFALAYAVQMALRLRAEENRALEFLLSLPAGRVKWVLINYAFIAISTAAILASSGFAAGLVAELTLAGSSDLLWPVIAGGLVQLPAILVIAGVVIAVFGLLPGWSYALAWAATGVSILLGPMFSAMINAPDWLVNFSPLSHTPVVPPTDNVETLPLVILSGVAALLLAVGLAAFRRRDITTN